MQTHHPFIPLVLLQVLNESSLIDKLFITDLALGIKAPADNLVISIPFNHDGGPLQSQRMLMDKEDTLEATPVVSALRTREGLLAGLAGSRHGKKEDKCGGGVVVLLEGL